MVNSFIITPNYFKLPENGQLVRESGIENRFNRAFERTDSNFTVDKDDWSDGVIRYNVGDEVVFYGIQECKRLKGSSTLRERFVQGLSYVCLWLEQFPELKSKFKVLVLPTEKEIDVIYLEDLLNSVFWTEFCFYFSIHRDKKGSASNFYKNNNDVRALVFDYIGRFPHSNWKIKEELDFKNVTEEILENCL